MKKWVRRGLGLVATALLLFSAIRVGNYILENYNSVKLNEILQNQVVKIAAESPEGVTHPKESVSITVDFNNLLADNPDIVGWLYCKDTPINYPILQSEDNSYYLRRLPDKTHNITGSLFVDYRNAADFSDRNTIIYGHNMRNDKMFGSLENYCKQDYYDAHPVMWLLLPDQSYKLELAAGCVIRSDSHFYNFPGNDEDAVKQVKEVMASSDFISEIEPREGDLWVTLSTCSYEFDNARYIVLGRLVPVD